MRRPVCMVALVSTMLVGMGHFGEAAAVTVAVARAGSGFGVVTGDVGGIACSPTCVADIAPATPVVLAAAPAPGSVFAGWLGPCTGTGACQFTVDGPTTVSATFALAATEGPTLDVDASNGCDAKTDGLLVIRYLLGLSGIALSTGATGSNPGRFTAAEIASYLTDIRPALDIDGNGQTDALTDGLLIARYIFGARGDRLVTGAVGPGATRSSAVDIEAHLAQLDAVCTAGAVAKIVIAPEGLLLTQFGATGQLTATAFDAQDNPVNVPIVWKSNLPATVSVGPTGAVQAGMAVGTALITASAGNVHSEPAYVYVATPVAGAVLIDDSQIVAGPMAVDPTAVPDPANPYEVVLHGVAAMPVDTVVINTGAKPVGGRVVAVQAQGADLLVRLVVVPPQDLFTDFAFNEVVDLSKGPFETPPELAAAYDVEQTGNRFVFTPKPGPVAMAQHTKVGVPQGTVALPPFNECESTVGFPSGLPLALSASPGFTISISGTLVNEITPQGKKIALSAAPVVALTTALEVTSAFEAKLTCKLTLKKRKLRAPGWAGLLFGGNVEFGVGFEVGGKVTLASAKLGGTASLKTALEAGILCPPGSGTCGLTGSASADAKLTPVFETPSLNQIKFDPSVSLFAFVNGRLGNADLRALQFSAIEARAGATLGASYTLESLQIDNSDPQSGRSKYQLDIDGKVGPGQGLGGFLAYVGLASFVPIKLSFAVPLGQSPTGTASSDQGLYLAGDRVNLEVKLNPATVNFLAGSLYNVDRVVVLRKTGTTTTEVLATQVAAPGQATFNFAFDAPSPVSASEMFAFVVPAFLGFDLLPRLEIASAQGAGARITATLPAQILASGDLIVTVETPLGSGQFGPAPNMLVEFTPVCGSIDPASGRTDVNGQLVATVTLDPGCASVTVDMTARVDPGTTILATQSAFAVRTRPRVRTVFPGQVLGPAALVVIVEKPVDNTFYEPAADAFVQIDPSCASVSPSSGRTDAVGRLPVTVSPRPGCASLSLVVTARQDPNTGLMAQTSLYADVGPAPAAALGGYDGTETVQLLSCTEDYCPDPRLGRWRLFQDNQLFILVKEVGGQFFCPVGPTSTCLLKFALVGGQFETAVANGMRISGSVIGGRLRFVLDRPCVNNQSLPDICRTSFDGTLFTLPLSPASLDFGTVQVGSTSASRSVTIFNAGLLPAQVAVASQNATAFPLNGNTCFQGLVQTFFLDAGASCEVTVQFKPQAIGTSATTLRASSGALGATVMVVPMTGVGN